ncbi:MAG: hypothetical protein JW940_20130 [Polyangiaceae bacterium]|nr:hypothetical protein [Polyangiaceae bacterium]
MNWKTALLSALVLGLPTPARADMVRYATPPGYAAPQSYPTHYERGVLVAEPELPDATPASTVRLFVGPALRVSSLGARVGALAAAEFGRKAAGLRLTGAWADAGTERGLSQYTGEFWLDLGMGELYHPILGAGAGVARVGQPGDADHPADTATVGIGVFRAAFEVVLPVRDTDARAGIEALGSLPVAKPKDMTASGPWALVVATVGVGF